MAKAKKKKKSEAGRDVGLHFYDLLIEGALTVMTIFAS